MVAKPAAVPAFPGRTATGVCMVIAPPALAVLCLLGTGIYKFKGHDFLSAMANHSTRTEIFLNFVPIAVFMLMLAVVGLAGMTAHRVPRLSAFGGGAALLGLCGPLFFVAIEFAGYQLSSPGRLADGSFMYDQANMVPRISVNLSGPAIVLGFVCLAVATYRAGLLSKVRAVCLALTALLPIGFIGAVLPVSAVGFVACSVALVPLGLALLRGEQPGPSQSPAAGYLPIS
jgi:hypothetical protein